MHRMLEKFNIDDPCFLSDFYKLQYQQFEKQEQLLKEQTQTLEKSLYPTLIPNDDIQRLLWIPGIGKMNAFTILLEVGDINRFQTEITSSHTAGWFQLHVTLEVESNKNPLPKMVTNILNLYSLMRQFMRFRFIQ